MNTNFKNRTTVNRISLENGNFATIQNSILNDSNLKNDTFRVIMFMLNQSQDYIVNTTYIAKLFKITNVRMAALLKELETVGFLVRKKIRNGKYFTGWEYIINEIPSTFNLSKVDASKVNTSNVSVSTFDKPTDNNTNENNTNKTKQIKEEEINNGVGVEETDISTTGKFEVEEAPTPAPIDVERKNKIASNIAIYSHIQQLFVIAFGEGSENAINFKSKFNEYYQQYLNNTIDTNTWETIKFQFEQKAKYYIQLKDIMKNENVDKYTANNILQLMNTVLSNNGSIDCIRGKNKIQRIKQLGTNYKAEWISIDAEEIIKDPNQQTKFNYAIN